MPKKAQNHHSLMWFHSDNMFFSKSYLAKRKAFRGELWVRESARPLAEQVLLFSSSHSECHVRHRPAIPRTPDIVSFSKSGRTVADALTIVDEGKLKILRNVSHVVILLGGNDISSRRGHPMPPAKNCKETAKNLAILHGKIKTMALRVTICTILPRPRDSVYGFVQDTNKFLWEMACQKGFRNDVLRLTGFKEEDFHDGVHLTAAGYAKLVTQLRAWCRKASTHSTRAIFMAQPISKEIIQAVAITNLSIKTMNSLKSTLN